MSVVNILDSVTDWVRENICTQIKLKAPPENDTDPTDSGYEYKLVTPAAFPLFVPAKDKAPPGILSPIPSVCVRFLEGAESPAGSKGSIGMQLCFSVWDPGVHGADMLLPGEEGKAQRWTGPEADAYFQRSAGGWRDAWNFVDIALRALGSTTNVGGYAIDRSVPMKFGPLTEEGAIIDAYPLWFAWCSFSVNYDLRRNMADISKFL
jgi:hypothetical protein